MYCFVLLFFLYSNFLFNFNFILSFKFIIYIYFSSFLFLLFFSILLFFYFFYSSISSILLYSSLLLFFNSSIFYSFLFFFLSILLFFYSSIFLYTPILLYSYSSILFFHFFFIVPDRKPGRARVPRRAPLRLVCAPPPLPGRGRHVTTPRRRPHFNPMPTTRLIPRSAPVSRTHAASRVGGDCSRVGGAELGCGV